MDGVDQCSSKMITVMIERFSFECRKVIGFASTTPRDWLKNLAPLFNPIRSKSKTSRGSLVHLFARFTSTACNYNNFNNYTYKAQISIKCSSALNTDYIKYGSNN